MKSFVKYLVHQVLFPQLLFFKVDVLLRNRSANRRLIIMYHGVTSKPLFQINGRHLPAQQFEQQLQYFKKNFDVVSLEEICRMQQENFIPKRRTIALTFDDGFLNNLQVALPLLEKYNLPATFFICSTSLLEKSYIHPSDLLDVIGYASGEAVINGQHFVKSRHHLINRETGENAYQYINSLPYREWEMVMEDLRTRYDVIKLTQRIDDEVFKVVSKETITGFADSDKATIGSHSHHHVNLARLSAEEIVEQLTTSKKILDQHAPKPVDIIAFPYGYYNDSVVSLSREAGYKYLIAAGDVEKKYSGKVFPRIGVLSAASYAYNILSINKGFRRFGF